MISCKGLVFAPNFRQKHDKKIAEAQNYIDNSCLKYLPNYTPIAQKRFKNRGKMSKSHVIKQPGLIINTEPKARKEYYTNKGFSGKLRGKYWFERMKADHKADILKGVNEK